MTWIVSPGSLVTDYQRFEATLPPSSGLNSKWSRVRFTLPMVVRSVRLGGELRVGS
jgi:hypothetical protein